MQASTTRPTILDHPIVQRAISVATFQSGAITRVARDRIATREAAIVVLITAFAQALGQTPDSLNDLFLRTVLGIAVWYLLIRLTFHVATNIFGTPFTQARLEHLTRTMGYAHAPALIGIVAFVPFLGGMISLAASVWVFLLSIWAVRVTTGIGVIRAAGSVLVSGIAIGLASSLVTLIFGLGWNYVAIF